MKGLSECKASESNIRRIRVRDIVKEVEDYLKTYSSAGMDISRSKSVTTIRFLCSYGGRILPRHPDGKLRYYGGETRVLVVSRSISFSGKQFRVFLIRSPSTRLGQKMEDSVVPKTES
ncbi:hypothetical protein Tco_0150320 [Tanacetum coccineum]